MRGLPRINSRLSQMVQNQTPTPIPPGRVDQVDRALAGGGVVLIFLTLVVVGGLLWFKSSETTRHNIRSAGRYGLIGGSFLIFTLLVRERIIEAETYVTLTAGALAGFGAYELQRRGGDSGDQEDQQQSGQEDQQQSGQEEK